MSNELPPLPEAWHGFFGNPHYSPDQMREYGRACERAAYERAAQLVEPKSPRPCDCEVCDCGNSGDLSAVVQWDEATRLAADIRALGADK